MSTVSQEKKASVRRLVSIIIGFGMLAMVGTLLYTSFTQSSLVVHNAEQMPESGAETINATTTSLTARLEKNPNDFDTLLGLSEHLLHTEDWMQAESFVKRAIDINPKHMKAHYILGIIQHKKGLYTEAVKTLEHGLTLEDTAPLRYNIGILYAFFIKDPESAKAMFEKALQAPAITPSLKKAIEEALQQISQTN